MVGEREQPVAVGVHLRLESIVPVEGVEPVQRGGEHVEHDVLAHIHRGAAINGLIAAYWDVSDGPALDAGDGVARVEV